MNTYTIGIIGIGTVGGGVYRQIKQKSEMIKERTGVKLKVKYVCDLNKAALKKAGVPAREQVSSYGTILNDPEVDGVCELIGGTTIAEKIVCEALAKGKDVVTANKALLAEKGEHIFSVARSTGRHVMFEASVGGGIPIIKGVREALASNQITTILSIINGTCNYILTRMSHDGMSFQDALKLAQEKGYAEANPSLDVDGIDAGHKIAILAQLAFGERIRFKDVACAGITTIQQGDISFARQLGYVIKLLAIAKHNDQGIEVCVEPALLPQKHILANVNDSYNAVYLSGDEVENMLFYGRGAGARPTASAVVSDIIDLARGRKNQLALLPLPQYTKRAAAAHKGIVSRYYVRMSVIDKPGVLARIASIMGRYEISISDVIQQERKEGHAVPLVLLTHDTNKKNIQQAVRMLNTLPVIKGSAQVLRIEA